MRRLWLACLMLAACNFDRGYSSGDDQPIDANMIDGDGSDVMCETYSSLFNTCAQMMGPTGLTLTPGSWTYNTDTGVLLMNGATITPGPAHAVIDAAAGPIDVLLVANFTIQDGATLRVTGPTNRRAFGIASTGQIQIDGIIDLSADGAGQRDDSVCGAQKGEAGENENEGAGGGGGGAFQGAGGGGSDGNLDGPAADGGAGGTALAIRPASPIGGCDGGKGGNGNGTLGGAAGDGGGAIYIASAASIVIGATGVLDVAGQGGYEGGNNGDAGGGGGSGGMILLESKSVRVEGVLTANGGGGGEGNADGLRGETGRRTTQRALGGAGGDVTGGDGANGGAGGTLGGASTTDRQNGGGGGGGGGVGYIAIACQQPITTGTAVITPAFAAW